MSFGSNLRQAMQARGIGSAELARRLGIKSQSVSQWRSDQTRPTGARFDELCRVLGVSPADLVDHAPGLAEPPAGLEDPARSRILAKEDQVFATLAARVDAMLRDLSLAADGPTVAVLARRVWSDMEALRGTSLPLEERMELALSEKRAALERARATRSGR
jgi:transcriptional regulator with XRE-family HTH domain